VKWESAILSKWEFDSNIKNFQFGVPEGFDGNEAGRLFLVLARHFDEMRELLGLQQEFIAHARTDLPAALDEIERLGKGIGALECVRSMFAYMTDGTEIGEPCGKCQACMLKMKARQGNE